MLHNTMNEPRIKHLEMIQAVINRLAGNSFMLKERDLFEWGDATHLNRGAGLYWGW
jgi:hypothetical protein